MKRWIIATAALGAMAMPVLGQNAADDGKVKAETRDGAQPAAGGVGVRGLAAPGAPATPAPAIPPAPATPKPPEVLLENFEGVINGRVENVLIAPPGAAAGGMPAVRTPVKKEKVTYLGVITSAAAPAMREQLKLGKGIGLVVDNVEAKTAAETAGIKQHDIIEKLNDQLLVNTEQFTAVLRSMKVGDDVTLSIIRQGERQSVKAKLGEKEIETGGAAVFDTWTRPAAPPGMGGDLGAGVILLNEPGNRGMGGVVAGNQVWTAQVANATQGVPMVLGGNVVLHTIDGKQTTEWSDDQFRISMEREGNKITKVTVLDAKTGKLMMTGTPPAANDPIFKTMPELEVKLKRAEEAATVQVPVIVDHFQGMGATGARGKVVQWQDGDHVMLVRLMANKPLYLLALSKKDGRTLYDGPVMTDEQRKSVPAEVSEQFEMLSAHPETAKEFGGAAPAIPPAPATPETPAPKP